MTLRASNIILEINDVHNEEMLENDYFCEKLWATYFQVQNDQEPNSRRILKAFEYLTDSVAYINLIKPRAEEEIENFVQIFTET